MPSKMLQEIERSARDLLQLICEIEKTDQRRFMEIMADVEEHVFIIELGMVADHAAREHRKCLARAASSTAP